MKIRVALFGGSFSPPSISHLQIAEQVHKQCYLDRVWLTPTYSYVGKESIDCNIRAKMLELLVDELRVSRGIDWLRVSKVDIEQKFTETYDTVSYLKKTYPHLEFYFVAGLDTAKDVFNWAGGPKLIYEIPWIVIGRHNETPIGNENWFRHYPHRYIDSIYTSISSTSIRNCIKDGKQDWRHHVHPIVAEFIDKKQLYVREGINAENKILAIS